MDALQLGVQGALAPARSTNVLTIDAVDPGAGTPGDEGLPRQRRARRGGGRAARSRCTREETTMSNATLIDTTKCIGCRSCQVTCKQWNDLPGGEDRSSTPGARACRTPRTLSANTFVRRHRHTRSRTPTRRAGCSTSSRSGSACTATSRPAPRPARSRRSTRPRKARSSTTTAKCIGCRYCMWACPFGVPTAEWDSLAPKIRKCTHCYDRLDAAGARRSATAQALTDEERASASPRRTRVPACVKQCPAGALAVR